MYKGGSFKLDTGNQYLWVFLIAAIAAIVLAFGSTGDPKLPPGGARPVFEQGWVSIAKPGDKPVVYVVEIARSRLQQQYGLMFIDNLPANQGMVFPYDKPQQTSFWMKNTLIPLDMIFIGTDGRISHIAANAQPGDTRPISGGSARAMAVLEVNAGQAATKGFAVGDRVYFSENIAVRTQ